MSHESEDKVGISKCTILVIIFSDLTCILWAFFPFSFFFLPGLPVAGLEVLMAVAVPWY